MKETIVGKPILLSFHILYASFLILQIRLAFFVEIFHEKMLAMRNGIECCRMTHRMNQKRYSWLVASDTLLAITSQ